jgi:hypothetical protein
LANHAFSIPDNEQEMFMKCKSQETIAWDLIFSAQILIGPCICNCLRFNYLIDEMKQIKLFIKDFDILGYKPLSSVLILI